MLDKIIDLGFKDIFSSMPAEFVTLDEAVKGKNVIRLGNGFLHKFDEREVDRASKSIPIYLWALVKLPFVILKLETPGDYVVNGDEWSKRAVSLLLGKDNSDYLTSGDVERLLMGYKSLIFITISYSILSSINTDNE
ncbi:MAG: DUF61 family protein [Candidatus Aramenus sp.]|jgi:uncharacterized protein (UPF0216 family)|nr:DUF61 family protein [Candidatus Aramenus sp.]